LLHFTTHAGGITALAYLGYTANFQMDESFSLHKEKNIQVIVIHETFLILRYLSWGLALIIAVSLYYYLKIVIKDGPLMFFIPS